MGLWSGRMTVGGWVFMVVVLALVIGLAVWAVCRLFPTPAQRIPDPRAALDARLAAGEVDLITYVQLRQQLDGATAAAPTGSVPVSVAHGRQGTLKGGASWRHRTTVR